MMLQTDAERAGVLVILGGLPGTGKTTIARALARKIHAVHLRIDTIEQAMLRSADLPGTLTDAGYRVAYDLARDNLALGHSVIADSVNPLAITRDAWIDAARRAGARFIEVEVVCSDAGEHRRRVEERRADIPGHRLPTWEEIVLRKYEPWSREHVVVDTRDEDVNGIVTALVSRIGALAVARAALE